MKRLLIDCKKSRTGIRRMAAGISTAAATIDRAAFARIRHKIRAEHPSWHDGLPAVERFYGSGPGRHRRNWRVFPGLAEY
jgi:hypothetical protein